MEVAEDFSAIADTATVRTAEHHRRGKKNPVSWLVFESDEDSMLAVVLALLFAHRKRLISHIISLRTREHLSDVATCLFKLEHSDGFQKPGYFCRSSTGSLKMRGNGEVFWDAHITGL